MWPTRLRSWRTARSAVSSMVSACRWTAVGPRMEVGIRCASRRAHNIVHEAAQQLDQSAEILLAPLGEEGRCEPLASGIQCIRDAFAFRGDHRFVDATIRLARLALD